MPTYHSASGSSAEDLFIELFSDAFGAEKAAYLYTQYPFSDIYQTAVLPNPGTGIFHWPMTAYTLQNKGTRSLLLDF